MTKKRIEREDGTAVDLILPHQVDEATRELAFKAFDKADDKAIVASLTLGRDTGADVYEFGEGKAKVHGLTITGATNLWLHVRKRFPKEDQFVINEIPDTTPGAPPAATILRMALRIETPEGEAAWGFIGQPTWYRRSGGSWDKDAHAEAKGHSKALRNAELTLLPPPLKEKYMRSCLSLKGRSVKLLTAADTKDPSGETAMKATVRARIMSISTSMGLDCGKDEIKNAVIAFIEGAMGVKMSEMPEGVLLKAKNDYEAFAAKCGTDAAGKEAFRAAVLGGRAS